MNIKFDMRDWNRTFEKYLSLRSKTRQEVTQAKATDFSLKAWMALPATDKERIRSELTRDKLLLKLTVQKLKARGINLKELPSVKVRRPKGSGGGTRQMSGFNKLMSVNAKKLLGARRRSVGYHRLAFVLLARKLGANRQANIRPGSMLNKSNVRERHSQYNDVYELNAVARGMNCPSTLVAREAALVASQADMEVYIKRKLDDARKRSGFK